MRNESGGFAVIDDEVATVLAFVISPTTFFSAQDDEMRRTTPAKPSEPVKPAPSFANDQEAARPPGANSEPLLSIEKGL